MESWLYPIDHKARHSVEELPKDLLGFCRQRSFPKSTIHQAHPSVAGSLIYMERRMPRAEAWMASLFDVSLRPSRGNFARYQIRPSEFEAWQQVWGERRDERPRAIRF
ncbi:MAG: hypothetical protein JWQ87_4775 [Candidatus Sulfotelmatobacter sp.]|nr:hypothetical protein [Candidatus Sulfotelmatobacter sp.]